MCKDKLEKYKNYTGGSRHAKRRRSSKQSNNGSKNINTQMAPHIVYNVNGKESHSHVQTQQEDIIDRRRISYLSGLSTSGLSDITDSRSIGITTITNANTNTIKCK